jgi:signal recognition particle subunit SRP54
MAGANLDEGMFRRQAAIIDSMTKAERKNPDLLKASRKKRVAAGSGVKVEDVNKLLKMHRQMADMMKMMGKAGKSGRGPLAGLGAALGFGGGQPQIPPEALEDLKKGKMPQGLPPGFPGAGGGLPPGFPGMGGGPKLPGLGGGFPGLGKKK